MTPSVAVPGNAPSPFRGCAAPSLSRREREKTPKAAKGEGDPRRMAQYARCPTTFPAGLYRHTR